MKVIYLFVLLLIGTTVQSQVVINPKVGANFMRLSSDPSGDNASQKARLGWNAGIDVRVGDRIMIVPGIHYVRYGSILRGTKDNENFDDEVYTHFIKVPIMVAGNLVTTNAFVLRLYGGPYANFLIGVDKNIVFDKDNFKSFNGGLKAGLGFDLGIFTLDLDYEYGLSKVFAEKLFDKILFPDNAKMGVINLSIGVKFGDIMKG
ncbi:MAG TPA: porin family protein [Saprospiraceae bacterium]|nr:porin family protein [Saprospiraceae bacterium]